MATAVRKTLSQLLNESLYVGIDVGKFEHVAGFGICGAMEQKSGLGKRGITSSLAGEFKKFTVEEGSTLCSFLHVTQEIRSNEDHIMG